MLRGFTNYEKFSEWNGTIDNEENNTNKFNDEGISYKGKLIGMEELPVDQDESTCREALSRLKASIRVRGEHKQKVQLNFSLNGIQIIEGLNKVELVRHSIQRISYVLMDSQDVRVIGYIFNTSDGRHQFWAIKMERPAHSAVLVLKGLFDEMYQHVTEEENKKNEIAQSSASLFDDTWGGNVKKPISLRTEQQQQQQLSPDTDPWGYSEPPVSIEKPVVTEDSPIPVLNIPPPPQSLTRRLTTTQPSYPISDINDLFPSALPSSTTNNEILNSSTVPQIQDTTNDLDFFTNSSSKSTENTSADDFFFS